VTSRLSWCWFQMMVRSRSSRSRVPIERSVNEFATVWVLDIRSWLVKLRFGTRDEPVAGGGSHGSKRSWSVSGRLDGLLRWSLVE
jgi:hypothetical protein